MSNSLPFTTSTSDASSPATTDHVSCGGTIRPASVTMNTLPALLEHATLTDLGEPKKVHTRSRSRSSTYDENNVEDTRMDTFDHQNQPHDHHEIFQPRPSTPRRSTEPYSSSLLNPLGTPRQRNRSPYSRTHLRSHSSSSPATAPPMKRAHSLPIVINATPQLSLAPPSPMYRPTSPLRSPARSRSPFRSTEESYSFAGTPSVCDISEESELDLTPKPMHIDRSTPSSPLISAMPGNTLGRRRRPVSPLHQVSNHNSNLFGTPTSSNNSSPMLSATRYNEPFPINFPASLSSSVPSTPTSTRSRSPSISSLETIPDSPDAELEAIEADRMDKLKAAEDGPRRSSLDAPSRPISFNNRDKRKRWSVCGGERRQDLDLETIYED